MPYSTRFFGGETSSSAEALYTVPAGYVAVLRDIEASNETGGTDSLNVLGTIPGPLTLVIFRYDDLVDHGWTQWKGRVVMNAGDEINVTSGAAGWYLLLSGYLLSAP